MAAPLMNRCESIGSSEITIINGCPCHSRCSTIKNLHCSVGMSAEHRSKFEALHQQWWSLYMSEKFSSATKTLKQTNKHIYTCIFLSPFSTGHRRKLCTYSFGDIYWNQEKFSMHIVESDVSNLISNRSLCFTLN